MRLFFALAPPAAARAALGAWQRAAGRPGWRWAEPEGLHLTLAFLGEVSGGDRDRLEALGAEVAARHRPFELASAELGQFPQAGAARILWLGVGPSVPLDALAADLRETLGQAGVAFDPKPFAPHLTLARRAGGAALVPPGPPPAFRWPVETLGLLRSDQGRYRAAATWPLR